MSNATAEEVRILRTRAEIEPLRNFWESCSPGRDADLDYFLFIVERYPEALRPHVLVLYEQGVPKVLLAGRLEESQIPVRFGPLALPVPRARVIQFVHGGLLGKPSLSEANLLVSNVIRTLRDGEADIAFLHYFEANSPVVKAARLLPGPLCVDHVLVPQPHWLRLLSRNTNGFLAELSQNERYQQRKRARKIEQDFPNHRIRTFHRLDELNEMIRDADIVARKSYQRGLGVGFTPTAIIRDRLEFETQKGWLHSSVLYLNEQPVAFWIATLRNRVFLSDYLAFDPTYANYAPGMYLVMKIIEALGDEPHWIDFGGGDASYKRRLSNDHREEVSTYIFAHRMKPISLNFLRTATEKANQYGKHILRKTESMERVKRIVRSRAAQQKPKR